MKRHCFLAAMFVPVVKQIVIAREPLVEPQVRPILAGDQIAKPLVRHLVIDDVGHLFALTARCGLIVNQQQALAKNNRAGILHCACREVRNPENVELLERILNFEVPVVVLHREFGGLQRKSQLVFAIPLLRTLVAHPGRVFSRRALLQAVWGDSAYREPRTIDVHVRHLREKLERDPSEPELILTVRGAGYRLREP